MINGMPKSGKFTIKKSNDQGAPGSSKNLVRDHLAGPKRASPTEEMDFDDIPVTTAPSSASRPAPAPPKPPPAPGVRPPPPPMPGAPKAGQGEGGELRGNLKDLGKFLSPGAKKKK
eukprot:Tamp_23287.p1 GENE.Tamp_23287~~Tamp_23287.p1  ORF type:complete len:116 (-),score=25.56 Tamp_23287:322-669(-)